jgi:hypothetical protein
VTVRDATAPAVTCPADLSLEATGSEGASATFAASAKDAVTASPEMTYSHVSGATFGLGTTKVTVTAKDAAGNANACSFQVTVKDTTRPTLACPAAVTVEATSASGALVTYDAANASDTVSSASVTYSQASGSEFALGTTKVTVVAKDAAGNESSCSFDVTVRDATAPALTCPADLSVEAADSSGAVVSFTAALASDAVTASPEVTYSHASGATFAQGETVVTVTAKDAAGNESTCAFTVTVRDTTAPNLTCPADVEVEASIASGRSVEYPVAMVSDSVSASPEVTYSQASGSDFAVGTTLVNVSTQDAAGNKASCSFNVTVKPAAKTDEGGGLGCASTGGSSSLGLWGAMALLSWLASWRPRTRRS